MDCQPSSLTFPSELFEYNDLEYVSHQKEKKHRTITEDAFFTNLSLIACPTIPTLGLSFPPTSLFHYIHEKASEKLNEKNILQLKMKFTGPELLFIGLLIQEYAADILFASRRQIPMVEYSCPRCFSRILKIRNTSSSSMLNKKKLSLKQKSLLYYRKSTPPMEMEVACVSCGHGAQISSFYSSLNFREPPVHKKHKDKDERNEKNDKDDKLIKIKSRESKSIKKLK
ncbi:uncharacterized protein MONOS_18151 [Monocercomonoides exilis]|uniref:uncharacterized protein n=1 Tax=Monocercomonoides exilis TaxID=2049356 RepID=UPI0035594D20|nr:hypothetical protein MONOS_18151 [Monocercomonoides exilis]